MATAKVRAQDPERLRLSVSNADPLIDPDQLDLSTVSAVVLNVLGPSGVHVVWPASIISQTATLLIVEHVWSLADIVVGAYRLELDLIVPAGVRRAGSETLQVIQE